MRKSVATIDPATAVSFRTPLQVSHTRVFRYHGFSAFCLTAFPICPRCNTTMEREYQAYCDRCGQALDWKHYDRSIIIF